MKGLVFVALAVGLAACAQQQPAAPNTLAISYDLYMQCLAANPPERCETPKARFEAERAYADSVSRSEAARNAARPPLVLSPLQFPTSQTPMPRQPITCTTYGNMTMCN